MQRELLTPYGLRTLDRGDPQYRGVYGGDPYARDSAYHQGTVWPWLMGPFLAAYLKVNKHIDMKQTAWLLLKMICKKRSGITGGNRAIRRRGGAGKSLR